MVVDQYLVFYRVNDEIKTVKSTMLRGSWNLPQYLNESFGLPVVENAHH